MATDKPKKSVCLPRQPTLQLSLQFADTRHRALLPRHKVLRWMRAAIDKEEVQSAQISVRIVDAQEGKSLNLQYRHKDYATNVLTFDYAHAPDVQADLVICAPVVERESVEQRKSLQSHYAHMLVHGVLHAQGWDHEADDEAQAMEEREAQIMEKLGFQNPYAT